MSTLECVFVRFGRLVTGVGSALEDATVLVEGDRITKVTAGAQTVPANARVVDLRPLTGIPGLIDVHTHMTFYWDPTLGTRRFDQLGSLGSAVTVFLAQENAYKTLAAGVTTVRDLGAFEGMSLAMRELIRREAMVGPRMFVAGGGLHVTEDACGVGCNPFRPGVPGADSCRADGVAEVLRAARQQIAAGADLIKLFASSGSGGDVTGLQTYGPEEIQAATDVAHRAGKRIAVHSYGPEGARDAVSAGVDSIEHAIDIDDATFEMMVSRGTVYVPTIDHNRYYIDHKDEFGFDQATVDRLEEHIGRNLETLRRALRFKVKVAMGSDAVFTGFGDNTRELEWFVRAGMTPEQALASATTVAAELLGMTGELGIVAPGAFADLAAIEGDPLKEISAVRQVKWVMKGGKVLIDKR